MCEVERKRGGGFGYKMPTHMGGGAIEFGKKTKAVSPQQTPRSWVPVKW